MEEVLDSRISEVNSGKWDWAVGLGGGHWEVGLGCWIGRWGLEVMLYWELVWGGGRDWEVG